MGATSVRQMAHILEHVETIVAIELLCAAQGVDFRRQRLEIDDPHQGAGTRVAYDLIRAGVPFLEHDVVLAPHIEAVRRLVANGTIKRAVESHLGLA
jgi:histidine ammonia-lyase